MVENTIDPCCGCIKLRTGCLIIGYFRLVLEITLDYYIIKTIPSWFNEVSGSFIYFLFLIGILTVVFLPLSSLFCILLIVSLHVDSHDFVRFYVTHARGCVFITLVFCIQKLVWPMTTQDFTLFRIGFILLLLQAYFLLVIYYYCVSMREKPQPATTAAVPAPVPAPAPAPAPAPVPDRCSDAK